MVRVRNIELDWLVSVCTSLDILHLSRCNPLQILLGGILVVIPATIFPHRFLGRSFINLELFHPWAVHILHHIICLPLLEAFAVGLVLVMLDLNKVRVDGVRVDGRPGLKSFYQVFTVKILYAVLFELKGLTYSFLKCIKSVSILTIS